MNPQMIIVRVPATTANIGPAFDCMGIALNLYTTVQFDVLTASNPNTLHITGCDPAFANTENLIYQAFIRTVNAIHQPIPSIALHIDSDIPVSRGLGSSAACIVAGVMAANALHGSPLTMQKMLEIATQLEGHPDNVAPALFGNLCLSMMDEQTKSIHTITCDVSSNIQFCALIPNHTLSTSQARAVLPNTIPFSNAIHNIGRSLLVLKSLEQGNHTLLSTAMSDKLHEPFRKSLIPDYETIKTLAKQEGKGAFFLSGAGPTLMYVGEYLPAFLDALKTRSSSFHWQWEVSLLAVDKIGATIERSDIDG